MFYGASSTKSVSILECGHLSRIVDLECIHLFCSSILTMRMSNRKELSNIQGNIYKDHYNIFKVSKL